MKCKLCNKEKKLIKAHIIPGGFFCRLIEGQKPLKLLTNEAGKYTKKIPTGIYDKNMVCRDCEDIFGPWDDYAQFLLSEKLFNSKPFHHKGKKIASIIKKYDYEKLKLFFISLLWRTSVSSHSFYRRICLGAYENKAKELILKANPGDKDVFSVTIAKFDHPSGINMLDPHKDKWSGVNHYRFYFASYISYIKVDRRPSPLPLSNFIISKDNSLLIIQRDLENSKELGIMQKLVNN